MSLTDRDQFRAWMDLPPTKEFFSLLRQKQVGLMERWAEGSAVTPEEQSQAVLLGQLARLRFDESEQDGIGMRAATIEELTKENQDG